MWSSETINEIRLIAIREVSPPFALRSNQGFSFITFPANTERRQLWNSTVNCYRWIYNERVHRKKQHASSIRTIPSKHIAFIQVFFFESANSMQYRSPTRQVLLSFDWTRAIASLVWSPNYAINLCGLTHCQLIYDMYSKCCLTVFTFTFAKRQIQSNIVHRTHI